MFNLLPRNPKFYDELETLSGHVVKAAEHLNKLARQPDGNGTMHELERGEQEADEVSRRTLDSLDTAFITPIDREDIYQLITEMHAAVETINGLGQRFGLYQIRDLDSAFCDRAENLSRAAAELDAAIKHLRKSHDLAKLQKNLDALHALERKADEHRRAFLGKLFEGQPDPLAVIQRKEMHDLLERAIDNCESVRKTLARVVLKNS